MKFLEIFYDKSAGEEGANRKEKEIAIIKITNVEWTVRSVHIPSAFTSSICENWHLREEKRERENQKIKNKNGEEEIIESNRWIWLHTRLYITVNNANGIDTTASVI